MAFEAALKERPNPVMFEIVPHGVGLLDPLQAGAKIAFRCFHQKVKMIAHQNISVEANPKAFNGFLQHLNKMLTVPILKKDGLPIDPSGHDMCPAAWMLNAQWPSHELKVIKSTRTCQC